jgi:RHS repeat-associated protein
VREGHDFGDPTPAIKYNLDDHLGSSNVLLDENGTLVSREEYYPFGETSFGSYGKKRYRFCGKERDEESGLYYYGARYYSPWTCRFVSVDPQALIYVNQSAYVYADNNPVCRIDHNGEGTGEGNGSGDAAQASASKAPSHGDSRTVNGCTEYWDSTSNDLEGAWVDHKPLAEVTISAPRSNASKEWKVFINNIGEQGYNDFVNKLYAAKLAPYQQNTGLNKSLYGSDSNGQINVPHDIRSTLYAEAQREALPTLKAIWAMEKSGVDPRSANYMFNPFARASYLSTRALAVSSGEEGLGLLSTVTFGIALQWIGGLRATNQGVSSWINMKNSKGGGITAKINGERVIGLDWHQFKVGGKKTGSLINRPHLDLPLLGTKHFPWHQIDKAKRGVN